jgi:ParB family chromosome partitioning protein
VTTLQSNPQAHSQSSTPQTSATSLRRKLGRGLGSLISAPIRVDVPMANAPTSVVAEPPFPPGNVGTKPHAGPHAPAINTSSNANGVLLLDLGAIHPNPRQPRQHFDEDALRALAASITSSGLMQPIVVRPDRHGTGEGSGATAGGYQIIAGERRWRAAQLARVQQIPAIVRDVDDQTAAEFSLIENLQREDLNPIERAEAFQRLIDDFQLTHNQIADRVGLDRTSVTNHVRLNDLDEFTKDSLRAGRLTLGHGKVLLAIANNEARAGLAAQAVRHAWSVRELEAHVRQWGGGKRANEGALHDAAATAGQPATAAAGARQPHLAELQRRLGEHLGTKVRIHPGRTKGSGRLVIEFFSLDQFEGLMRAMQFVSDDPL